MPFLESAPYFAHDNRDLQRGLASRGRDVLREGDGAAFVLFVDMVAFELPARGVASADHSARVADTAFGVRCYGSEETLPNAFRVVAYF